MKNLTISEAQRRAQMLFGPTARCETIKRRGVYSRNLTIQSVCVPGALTATRLETEFPAAIPWQHVFSIIDGLRLSAVPLPVTVTTATGSTLGCRDVRVQTTKRVARQRSPKGT